MARRPAAASRARPKSKRPRSGDALARRIVAGSPDAIVVTSVARRVLAANEAAARLFEMPLNELIGAAVDELVIPADRARVERHEEEARRGHPQRYETRVFTSTGAERIVAVASSAVRERGRLMGTAASMRDITEESHAYDELAMSEARYRHLFEGASDAIMTFDASATFTTVNYAGEMISGYSRDELLGRFFGPLIAEDEIERALAEFRRALGGGTGQFETVFVRKDGGRRNISVTYSCPKLSEEVLCIVRDVTEQKQLQQQLIQSEKMAAIGQLVSGVAHELNNPLASVSAFAQLLLVDRRLASEQKHSAEVIAGEARRAARIVNNLLTFARQHKAEKVPADINRVLENTLELRAYELNVRGISLVRDYAEPMPHTMADVHQLQQVFLNIMTNAEHAMAGVEERRHQLTVRTRATERVVCVQFEDTGPGIPHDSLQRIFNPFYTTKPTGQGTGLGLSISLGIVSEHGGRIWAENVHPVGTRFTLEIPIVDVVRGMEPEPREAAPSPVRGLHILVVDDEEPLRQALETFLSGAGHSVTCTGSGAEALALAAREHFDAIVLDIRMPDLSGQQIFARLRELQTGVAERVIFMTGDIVSADLREFLSHTGRAYIAKPFEFADVLRALPQRSVNGVGNGAGHGVGGGIGNGAGRYVLAMPAPARTPPPDLPRRNGSA